MIRSMTAGMSLALLLASPALANPTAFSGSYENSNPPAALDGRCAPAARTVTFGPGIGIAAGISSLGSFVPSGSHCIVPPLPTSYNQGQFSFDFGGGDSFVGSYSGTLSATGAPNVFDNVQNFVVTGGTGRFIDASGAFTGIGTVTFQAGQLPYSSQQLSGTLNLPAVPEPATWATLMLGLGGLGAAARLKRRRAGLSV